LPEKPKEVAFSGSNNNPFSISVSPQYSEYHKYSEDTLVLKSPQSLSKQQKGKYKCPDQVTALFPLKNVSRFLGTDFVNNQKQ